VGENTARRQARFSIFPTSIGVLLLNLIWIPSFAFKGLLSPLSGEICYSTRSKQMDCGWKTAKGFSCVESFGRAAGASAKLINIFAIVIDSAALGLPISF